MDLPRPASVQNAFSLLDRTWDNGLAEVACRERFALLAHSPLGFGLLSQSGDVMRLSPAAGTNQILPAPSGNCDSHALDG